MFRLFKYKLLILVCLSVTHVKAQVDQIKSSSSSNSANSSRSSDRGSNTSSSGFFAYFFVDLIGNGIVVWQGEKLSKKERNPRIVSLELPLQAAAQPSNYYLLNPRIRGN